VADLLAVGDGTAVRRRRRWTTPVAGIAVAAVAVVLAGRAGGSPDPPPPVAVDGPEISVRPAPNPGRTSPAPEPVARLDGDPGPARPGLRLMLGGDRPGVLDLGTGRLTAFPGLPARPGDTVEVRRTGRTTALLVTNPAEPDARAYVLPDGGRAVDLGPVRDALPLRDGTVLTVRCATGAPGCLLAARSATGARLWQRGLPRAARLVRETLLGVVLWVYDGGSGGGQVRIEDPRSGQPTRRLGRTYAVLTADQRHVAYQPLGCQYDCPIVVTALADGSRRTLPVAPGAATTATFSPDGRWLAVGFQGLDPWYASPGADRDGHLAVADLAAGTWHRMPGLTTAAHNTPLPVWTGTGELLVAAGRDGDNRFVAWTVGAPRITVLPIRIGRTLLRPDMVALLD